MEGIDELIRRGGDQILARAIAGADGDGPSANRPRAGDISGCIADDEDALAGEFLAAPFGGALQGELGQAIALRRFIAIRRRWGTRPGRSGRRAI